MFEVRNGIKYLILIYLAISILIWYYKPKMIFNEKSTKISAQAIIKQYLVII